MVVSSRMISSWENRLNFCTESEPSEFSLSVASQTGLNGKYSAFGAGPMLDREPSAESLENCLFNRDIAGETPGEPISELSLAVSEGPLANGFRSLVSSVAGVARGSIRISGWGPLGEGSALAIVLNSSIVFNFVCVVLQ